MARYTSFHHWHWLCVVGGKVAQKAEQGGPPKLLVRRLDHFGQEGEAHGENVGQIVGVTNAVVFGKILESEGPAP